MVLYRRFSLALSAVSAALVRATTAFLSFAMLAVQFVAKPSQPLFSGEGGPLGNKPFLPLDRALQHDLRHEARVSRRSAARHT